MSVDVGSGARDRRGPGLVRRLHGVRRNPIPMPHRIENQLPGSVTARQGHPQGSILLRRSGDRGDCTKRYDAGVLVASTQMEQPVVQLPSITEISYCLATS